jgi:hypothetical protein
MLRQELELGQGEFQNYMHDKELQEKPGGFRGQTQALEEVKATRQKIHSRIRWKQFDNFISNFFFNVIKLKPSKAIIVGTSK